MARSPVEHPGDANVESPGGISPPALPEPCMTLSSHTTPDVRPLP
jgi:hypothetical protein